MQLNLEYYQLLFIKYMRLLDNNPDRRAKRIKKKFSNKYYGEELEYNKALEVLYELKNEIEEELKIHIEKKSIHYWLHLYRRVSPRGKGSVQTILIFRSILEMAFYKYGKREIRDELLIVKDGTKVHISKVANGEVQRYNKIFGEYMPEFLVPGIYLGNFGYRDYYQIYELEELAIEFWWVTTCIRRLHKGGNLKVTFNEYEVECDKEDQVLMSFYDNRESHLSTLTGVALNPDNPTGLLPMYNVELKILPTELLEYFELEEDLFFDKEFIPNMKWGIFNFNNFYTSQQFLEEEFKKYYGFTLMNFTHTCFLITFEHISSCYKNTNNVLEMFKRAYRYYSDKDEFVQGLYELNKLCDFGNEKVDITIGEIDKIISYLILDYDNRQNISLTTLGPSKMILEFKEDNFILVDYLQMIDIILKITHPLTIDNKKEKEKGYIFENFVIDEFENAKLQLWECKKELKQDDNTSKEIDVSFICKNILFVCECKSNKQSIVFSMIGDKKSLDFRKKKNEIGLSEANEKVEWLVKDSKPLNYNIPENVEYIVPVLITPFVEYIWSLSDELWLSRSSPRIIMCRELLDFVRKEAFDELISKSYVKKLN